MLWSKPELLLRTETWTKPNNIQKGRKMYKCQKCTNIYRSQTDLNKHKDEVHTPRTSKSGFKKKFSHEEKKRNGFCRFWNHAKCRFEEDQCMFMHEEAPHCRFQNRCSEKLRCQFFHADLAINGNPSSFLGFPPLQPRWKGKY